MKIKISGGNISAARTKEKEPIPLSSNVNVIQDSHINGDHIKLFLLNGLGDMIYQWYTIASLVKQGWKIDVQTTDALPQRAHQILGCLEGMSSFKYVPDWNHERYILVEPGDLMNPNPRCLFNGVPVLHVNSFLENNIHMENFLPQYPIDYDIDLITSLESVKFAENFLDKDQFNLFVYCSNYQNNINCKMHPDPIFWADLAELIFSWQSPGKPLKVNVFGADYDMDLSKDLFEELRRRKIDSQLCINFQFKNVIEIIRQSDFVCCYESGMGQISGVVKTKFIEIFRCQGGTRNDKNFPYLGPFPLDSIGNRFWPFFYDDTIGNIAGKLK